MRDREELVRRWQAGWSVSRGWTTVEDDNDGILIVRAGEESRPTEYVVLDAEDLQKTLGLLLGWATRHGLRLDDLTARPASLEEAFLAIAESDKEVAA